MTDPLPPPSPDPSVGAPSLSEDRGGSVLVTGATVAARAQWLDECARAVIARERPAPLVVRVKSAPLASASAASLADEIAAAAESALVSAGAPGGLYDESSGPLGALGGWLFRARSVGRRGLLLVLDELDGWLDARGTQGGAAALAVLERALTESTRRPLAIVASVRGADAAGDAAVPAPIASRFQSVVRLGGSATVMRDPATLVSALAGRTFSLRALKNALAGWLDVPDEDNSVLVFSTPNLTVDLPLPPAAGTPKAAAAAAPADESLDWSRAPRSLTPREGTPATRAAPKPESAPGAIEPEHWGSALRAAVRVRDALAEAARLGPPKSFRQFERAYRDVYSHLPLALASLTDGEKSLAIESTQLRVRGAEELARFEAAFASHYPEGYESWLAGAPRPAMLHDLPARVARLATERGARGTALVVLTGLRLDAWRRLREKLLPAPRIVAVEEGVHWAARPATPATQRELLARGLEALAGPLPRRDEPVAPRSADEALTPRREHLGRVEITRIDAYAATLTRSKAPLIEALGEIESTLPGVIRHLFGTLPPRTVVAIAGDVGLREVTRRADERESGRHAYGGDSPFEAIVPYAILEWT